MEKERGQVSPNVLISLGGALAPSSVRSLQGAAAQRAEGRRNSPGAHSWTDLACVGIHWY